MHIDFETYSEAGYVFDNTQKKWVSITQSPPFGLGAVGAAVYAEHPSTEILCLAYDEHFWKPGDPPPTKLLNHVESGGTIFAWNCLFEFWIWQQLAHKKMGWPPLKIEQLRDPMARARAFTLPSSLKKVGEILNVESQKIDTPVLKIFSVPRNPSKTDPRRRIRPWDFMANPGELYAYNIQDVRSETEIEQRLPELTEFEHKVFLLDLKINNRGVFVDKELLNTSIKIIKKTHAELTKELSYLTENQITSASQVKKICDYTGLEDLSLESLEEALKNRQKFDAKQFRVLEIRHQLASASIKKTFAIKRRISQDGRLRGMFAYCGADRTGRWAGRGPQPQNLPASFSELENSDHRKWVNLNEKLESHISGHPRPLELVGSYLRALLCAPEGKVLICSDFSSIEAVVLSFLSNEEWRKESFYKKQDIYKLSASRILKKPVDMITKMERRMGKIAELALGYGGGINAWRAFDSHSGMSEFNIKKTIENWRQGSPQIIKFWARCESAMKTSIYHPHKKIPIVKNIYAYFDNDTKIASITLPSKRNLYYHNAHIDFSGSIGYRGGPAWVPLRTYGGKLTENIVQGVARDLLAHALINLEDAGYPVVMHIHDEIVCEIPEGYGSLEEFERIMSRVPDWAAGWPVRATGGWVGKYYRK
jgi:DNA polymerase